MAKKPSITDQHAQREASRYANPIPSREFILDFLEQRGEPATHEELCAELRLQSKELQQALQKRLVAMCRDGQIISNRRNAYGLINRMDLIKGHVVGNKDGYGFLIPEDGSDDLFLNPRQMQRVFNGDEVIGRVSGIDRRGRREGKIVEILKRKSSHFVGRYYKEAGAGIVIPHNKRITQEIMIPARQRQGAKEGDFVLVEITRFPEGFHKAQGKITEVLGDVAKPGMGIEVALHTHNIPYHWPETVLKDVDAFPDEPDPVDMRHREDYRSLSFVTIDGEDAKDFDDAVYCESQAEGWTLYVAIADVSHYVPVNSPLDQEARNRGTSVYFPGHVVPMLPEKLSNRLCSLRPDTDRLVMVCKMDVSKTGEITHYEFSEGVIHSHARLTYTEVAAIIQPAANESQTHLQEHLKEKYPFLVDDLENLYALYKVLHSARQKRGALDIETVETRFVFTEDQKLAEILEVERNDAHRLIEECMLCANVSAANLFIEMEKPALYRVHAGPNPDRVENLYDFLRAMGIGIARKEDPTPQDYQVILNRLADRPDRMILQTLVIRSLMQANYSPDNLGHFGLGYIAYTHFTSPIRRYPDLLVHRAIRHLIRSKTGPHLHKIKGSRPLSAKSIYPYSPAELDELGSVLSAHERRADAAGYDVADWLKCEYIEQHVGDSFDATIVTVTNFGLFVELDDIHIEGLIHVTALRNDYYHYNEVAHSLTGERTGESFQLGDRVHVQVANVNMDEHKIDFQLISSYSDNSSRQDIPQRERSAKKSNKNSGAKTRRNIRKKKTTNQEKSADGNKSRVEKNRSGKKKTARNKQRSKKANH